jgi:hypothetical protein
MADCVQSDRRAALTQHVFTHPLPAAGAGDRWMAIFLPGLANSVHRPGRRRARARTKRCQLASRLHHHLDGRSGGRQSSRSAPGTLLLLLESIFDAWPARWWRIDCLRASERGESRAYAHRKEDSSLDLAARVLRHTGRDAFVLDAGRAGRWPTVSHCMHGDRREVILEKSRRPPKNAARRT